MRRTTLIAAILAITVFTGCNYIPTWHSNAIGGHVTSDNRWAGYTYTHPAGDVTATIVLPPSPPCGPSENSTVSAWVGLDDNATVEQTVATNSMKIRVLEDRKSIIEGLVHRQEELEKQAALTAQPINAFQATMEEVKELLRSYMEKMETFTIDIERRVTVLETKDRVGRKKLGSDST